MKKSLFLISSVLLSSAALANYNAFTFNDYVSSYSDSEAGVISGGSFYAGYYSVNGFNVSTPGLIAKDNVYFTNGFVGNGVSAGNIYLDAVGNTGGQSSSSNIDFAAMESFYRTMSSDLANQSMTGTVTSQPWGQLILQSNSTTSKHVFNIDSSLMSGVNQLTLAGLNAGDELVINFTGTGNLTLSNLDLSYTLGNYKTVLNMPTLTYLTIESTSPWASILAPEATILGSNGHIQGSLVANSFSSRIQLHYDPNAYFAINTMPIPEPSTWLLMGLGLAGIAVISRKKSLSK